MNRKPLNRKAYGSIGHLPSSRLGPGDWCVTEGQARICTEKARDKHDNVIVQEKLDGSCTAVALVNGEIIALSRAGYLANTSPYEQHHLFADWVEQNESRFRATLKEGERIVGEWLAQARGTIYDLSNHEPWSAFDIMQGGTRLIFYEFLDRIAGNFGNPSLLSIGEACSVLKAIRIHKMQHVPCDSIEGIVYRVERKGKVDFLAKWVRPDKVDGKHLPKVSGKEAVWNWKPEACNV